MKIGVMGAGAVGCYYGGMLARAGHEVVLVGRPTHVEALKQRGLRLQTAAFDVELPVRASTEAVALIDAALVLFCVKSTDTEAAGLELRDHLAPDALVLSLQNGVDNAERLQALVGVPVWPAVVYVAAEMAGPGHVKHNGRGELVIGPTAVRGSPGTLEAAGLLALLGDAGVPAETGDNVAGVLWAKLVLNCAYNALSALTNLPYGPLVAREGIARVMDDLMAECLAVAAADGVRIPGEVPASVRRIAQTMPAQFSSTAQDLRRGRRSEIDHLNGYVVRRGEATGTPTPVNRCLHALVKALEAPPA
ncbi:2-dehydropantoate 2-reductase [Methylibium sp. Pch-M]|uniref:ketopantoate reductase family protein n=1 Tax=Methylibium sp. Pch-M TaxID=2082386 RepID=UPI001012FB26|nr:2-dehydropantoate 2-reductase [Methylibium sp. Pch-M]QAZ38188.1 2-dehydropantoate 2-reductase [Methylibium sp. Pch-M]